MRVSLLSLLLHPLIFTVLLIAIIFPFSLSRAVTVGQFNFLEMQREKLGILPELEEIFLSSSDLVRVGIRLRITLDAQAADQILTEAKIPRKERVHYISEAVRLIAEKEQKDLLSYLKELEKKGLVKNINSLPISNCIYLETSLEVARGLAKRPDIAYLHPDRQIPIPPLPKSDENQDNPKTTNWGLAAMGVQTAWSMGYNGTGMVVSNIDNGVRHTHQQLNDTWRSENGWYDPYGNTTVPQPGSHGTPVMGIMTAENDSSGHIIGIAPNSQWIACRAGSSTFTNVTIEACANWMVMTSHPDVVNNSFSSSTAGCNNWFKDDIAVMKSAGIFVSIGAGNSTFDGSPANSEGAFSVGATDSSGNIMSGSGQGPSDCTSILFPSAVAPGVDTFTVSSSSDTAYGNFSGTSASTPHAAGAAALVMQAHPNWSISQVEEALMFNAEDLGAAGFDTIFGTGEIYIPDAINHNASTLNMSKHYIHLCYPGAGATDFELTCSGYTGSLSWYSYDPSIVTVTPIDANSALVEVVNSGYTFVTVTDSAGHWGWTLASVNDVNGADNPNDCICCDLAPKYVSDLCYQGTGSYYHTNLRSR